MPDHQEKLPVKHFTCSRSAHPFYLLGAGLLLLLILGGCGSTSNTGADIKEIRPGVLEGYLAPAELPSSLLLLSPPPMEGSAAFEMDLEVSRNSQDLQDTLRLAQAKKDANLHFPEAIEDFSALLDIPITQESTPHLYLLLRRILTDAGLSTYNAKNHYRRTRPFMLNNLPTCSPEDEEYLRQDGSYPSGHTAIGWAWALVLCEIFPGQTDALLDRGREFGESRIICNVHWYSDVDAGRLMGAATVARLHADPEFNADLKAARKEVSRLKQR